MDSPLLLFLILPLFGLLSVFFLVYSFRRRSWELAGIAQRAGFTFSKAWNDASFAGFPSTLGVGERMAELDAVLKKEGVDPAMQAMVKARAAAALGEPGFHQTALAWLPMIAGKTDPSASNIVSGRVDGRDMVAFDYSCSRGDSHEAEVIGHTVAAVRLPGQTLPAFLIAPRSIGQRWLAAIQHPPQIAFEHHPEFGKRFIVRGEDAVAVRAALTPHVMNGFVRLPEDLAVTIEGARDCLAVYYYKRDVAPHEVLDLAQTAADVSAIFAPVR